MQFSLSVFPLWKQKIRGGLAPAVNWSLLRRCYSFAEWWHLLSLDAPTVAVLWSWFFARAMHLDLPVGVLVSLGIVTWLLYVADRILDGISPHGAETLRERHIFYSRHRLAFLTAAPVLAALSAWMVITHIRPRALHDDLFLSIFVVLYLLAVHVARKLPHSGNHSWLPKELAVGALFACATAVPAWSRLSGGPASPRTNLAEAVALFAVLCWINCAAIEKWEAGTQLPSHGFSASSTHASTRWIGLHLQLVLAITALLSLVAAWRSPTRGLMAIYLAALLSSSLFLALDARRSRLTPLSLRIAADAALLTPLALFPFVR